MLLNIFEYKAFAKILRTTQRFQPCVKFELTNFID